MKKWSRRNRPLDGRYLRIYLQRNRRLRCRQLRTFWTFSVQDRANRSRIHGPSNRSVTFPCEGNCRYSLSAGVCTYGSQPFPAVVEGLEAEGEDAEDGDDGESDDGVEEAVVVGRT